MLQQRLLVVQFNYGGVAVAVEPKSGNVFVRCQRGPPL